MSKSDDAFERWVHHDFEPREMDEYEMDEYEMRKIGCGYKISDIIDLYDEFPSDNIRYDKGLNPFTCMQELMFCPKCHEKTLFWECDAESVRYECFNPERDENNNRCDYHACFRRFPFNEAVKQYIDDED